MYLVPRKPQPIGHGRLASRPKPLDRQSLEQATERLEAAQREFRELLEASFDQVSSSEIRRRIREGEAWEHLAPAAIVEEVRRLYGSPPRGVDVP